MREVSATQNKFTLYIDVRDGGILQSSNRELRPNPESDFWIPVFLTKTGEVHEYVDVQRDEETTTVERQNFNPFFIEHAFFDSIKRNKINEGADFTNIMIGFVKSRRPDVFDSNSTDQDVVNWFDTIGINEFPWNKGTDEETTLDDIEKSDLNTSSIISKSTIYPITINS